MNLQRLFVVHAFAAILGASPAWAQDAPSQPAPDKPDPRFERARVKLAEREVRGRLVRFDSETLTIEVEKRQFDLPMSGVLQIDGVERDSLRNGALFGALYVAACVKFWCGQGLDSARQRPTDIFFGAGMGALVGAGIDALFSRRTTLYKAGAIPELRPLKGGVALTLRF